MYISDTKYSMGFYGDGDFYGELGWGQWVMVSGGGVWYKWKVTPFKSCMLPKIHHVSCVFLFLS